MTIKEERYSDKKRVWRMPLPFHLRLLYWLKLKKEKDDIKKESKQIITSTYKQFDYYCPHCLFQTNDYNKLCPECRRGRLLNTKTEE